MAILAGMIFVGSFFYEGNVISSVAQDKGTQVMLGNNFEGGVNVNRAGKSLRLAKGQQLEIGDTVESGQNNAVIINFSKDGEIRLGVDTKLQIVIIDESKPAFIFKLVEGKIWLNNLYSNADLNILVDSGVIIPGQSIDYLSSEAGQTIVYAHQQAATVGFVDKNYLAKKYIDENDSVLISRIYLPQSTQMTVYSNKIAENRDTVAKLLFSKLVKEFNYSNFDKSLLITDEWLSKNVELDASLTSRIRDGRLKKIRTRGLKYSSLEASNYKIDATLRDLANTMTFSQERVGDRNLDALYDLLYDAQYLFDYGRKDEATERLNTFTSLAGELFVVYGDELKSQYQERVKNEYEYLSFANPSDALFGLKLVLEKIYLDSLKGGSAELATKFAFLTEKINTLGYYADNNDLKNLKDTFDEYMIAFKSLTDQYKSELTANITYVQRQNQALDNLFVQHPQLYRQAYFTGKLYVENKYLSLLPSTSDKIEEIQAVISQRIDFLRRLENFFLEGNVPLIDAQNILALLFTEISRIELPADSQVAVSQLFRERLEDYGVFNRFLNSPEYVNSTGRGTTYKQRFEQFKKDNQESVSIDQLRSELSQQIVTDSNSMTGTAPGVTIVETTEIPGINEETVIQNVDGTVTEGNNEVDSTINKPKVPRVKNPN
ncbi:hypothetical protein IT411_00130 [Candidatus Peregrinibacteria bacterium]|nr:hypothetical protein [Candidatus Peregrinibacteria bacterium]